jgi:hypothetical protein
MLDEVRQKAEGSEKIVIDVCSLDFCYSQCVRALFEFSSTDSHNRPALHYVISKNAWQVTSLRAMVGFSPNCTISECYISGCRHVRTTSEDQNYLAIVIVYLLANSLFLSGKRVPGRPVAGHSLRTAVNLDNQTSALRYQSEDVSPCPRGCLYTAKLL